MNPESVRGIDLILHRMDQQDRRLEAIYSEVRATNGRVSELEQREARREGEHVAEVRSDAENDSRRDFWRDRLTSFFLGSFSALLVAVLIEALK